VLQLHGEKYEDRDMMQVKVVDVGIGWMAVKYNYLIEHWPSYVLMVCGLPVYSLPV